MSDTEAGGSERDEWDGQWVRICEMNSGIEDPFPEFADEVTAAMERVGNEVGRPLVMKVKVQVYDGELNRPVDTETEQ